MEFSTWFAIYMPLLMLFAVILPMQQAGARAAARRLHAKRRRTPMTNEVIAKYIGKSCLISTGSYGVSVSGTIVAVNENWIEVETKKGRAELVNADYVQSVRILEK